MYGACVCGGKALLSQEKAPLECRGAACTKQHLFVLVFSSFFFFSCSSTVVWEQAKAVSTYGQGWLAYRWCGNQKKKKSVTCIFQVGTRIQSTLNSCSWREVLAGKFTAAPIT
ncbi:unnamed protein product [Discosporangium mesarthrocarpum]